MASDVDIRPINTTAQTVSSPKQIYAERKDQRLKEVQEREQQMDAVGRFRVLVFLMAVIIALFAYYFKSLSGWWLIVPALAFLILVIRFDRIRRQKRRAERAVRFYDYGLDRLQDRWVGRGHTGERFLSESHLYALDLDIFGHGSLFERLSLARTQFGEKTLAEWLRAPATPKDIESRQQAVQELKPRLDLREDIALLGGEVPPMHYDDLVTWGESPRLLNATWLRWIVVFLAVCNVLSAVAWLIFSWSSLFLAVSLTISGIVALPLLRQVSMVLQPIEEKGRELVLLSSLLQRIEQESMQSPLMASLQQQFRVAGKAPSEQIARLAFLVDWINALRNQFFLPVAILLLWRIQMAFAVEAWRQETGKTIGTWLKAIGIVEAVSSLAGYAFENPDDIFPKIMESGPHLVGEELGHPLLSNERVVRNSIHLDATQQALIISGSNMSGKSTYLRTVGVNTVLALAGGPVRAKALSLSPLAIVATLRVQDSLLEGRSRFFAEITRVRELLQKAGTQPPVFFLLDELFHGTNSHDRCIGAEALMQRLLAAGAIGLLTTHDLTLTQITERLDKGVRNVHFADQFVDGEMHFDYKMRDGIVPHSNALVIMRAIGLEV